MGVLIAAKKQTVSAEFGYLATLRATYKGHRTVIACSLLKLLEFAGIKSESTGKTEPKVAYDWLKAATVADAKAFQQHAPGNSMFFGTVGPHDILYTPAGYCFLETTALSDVLGLKCSLLSGKDHEASSDVNRYLLGITRPSQALARYIDTLSICS